MPMCDIDTDDTSSTSPNGAVTWCVQVTEGQAQYSYAYCSVNRHTPFQVGIYQGTNPPSPQQANNSWVALSRQYGTHGGEQVIIVAVAFNYFVVPSGNPAVYGQVFYVSPSTGQPVASTSPMVLNGWMNSMYHVAGTNAIGGIAGDDYGNFVVAYIRQYVTAYSNPVGTYASTITSAATPGVIEAKLSSNGSQYTWSRVACYHGSSSTSGGFVVAASPAMITSIPIDARRTGRARSRWLRPTTPPSAIRITSSPARPTTGSSTSRANAMRRATISLRG